MHSTASFDTAWPIEPVDPRAQQITWPGCTRGEDSACEQTSEVFETSEVSSVDISSWFGPLTLAATMCSLLVLTWRKWPHVLVDFGRELYVPWQITEGALLYRDVAYFNGPFSPYFNAGLFYIFGVSLTTLIVANIVLLAVLVGLIYHTFARWFDRATSTVVCFVFLCAFCFAQLDMAGNYNYICPYSHEMTHGIFFALVTILGLTAAFNSESTSWQLVTTAGLCWGFTFLGKPEIWIATTIGAGVCFALPVFSRATSISQLTIAATTCLFCGLLPVALFFVAFLRHMPIDQAFLAVTGSWQWILATDVTSQHFYQRTLGLDQPIHSLLLMARAVFCVALVITFAVCYDRWLCGNKKNNSLAAVLGTACLACAYILRTEYSPFLVEGRAMLVAALLTLCGLTVALWRCREDMATFQRLIPLLPWAVVGLLLLGKLMLIPRVHHYGFVLAMPATILALGCLIYYGPAILCRGTNGRAFRTVICCAILLDAVGYVVVSSNYYANKTVAVGQGHDQIMVSSPNQSPMASSLNQALSEIRATVPPDATFVVLPEGIMINYLTRRQNPTPYINFMPPEIVAYGEQRIELALRRGQPDYVLLVHKPTTEYGVGFFGCDEYCRSIMDWVNHNYEPAKTYGAEPLVDVRFGIKLLVRKS